MHIALNTSTNALTAFATIVSSSLRGEIARKDYSSGTGGTFITPLLDIMPEETIGFFLQNTGNLIGNVQSNQVIIKSYEYTNPTTVASYLPYSDISSSANPSDQAYIEYNQTPVGLLGEVVNNQDEFYDGEFSGSTLNAGQFYNAQYNPYLRVSKDSIPNNRTVNLPVVDFTSGTTQLNTRLKQGISLTPYLFPGALDTTVTTAGGFTYPTDFIDVPITITSGTVTGTILAEVRINVIFGTAFTSIIKITNTPPPNITIGTTLQIPANTMTGVTSDVNMEVTAGSLSEFSNITTDGFDVTNQYNSYYIFLAGQPSNLLNGRKYLISFGDMPQ